MSFLWHMHSNILDGFYRSDVYVAATHKHGAIRAAMTAFEAWEDKQVYECYFHPLIFDLDPEDPGWDERVLELRNNFRKELENKLEKVPGNALIERAN